MSHGPCVSGGAGSAWAAAGRVARCRRPPPDVRRPPRPRPPRRCRATSASAGAPPPARCGAGSAWAAAGRTSRCRRPPPDARPRPPRRCRATARAASCLWLPPAHCRPPRPRRSGRAHPCTQARYLQRAARASYPKNLEGKYPLRRTRTSWGSHCHRSQRTRPRNDANSTQPDQNSALCPAG